MCWPHGCVPSTLSARTAAGQASRRRCALARYYGVAALSYSAQTVGRLNWNLAARDVARQRIGELLLEGADSPARGDVDLSPAQVLPRAFGDDAPEIGRGIIVIPDISGYTG